MASTGTGTGETGGRMGMPLRFWRSPVMGDLVYLAVARRLEI